MPPAVFAPAAAIFPELESTPETLACLLRQLSRTDTLFWCSRFNLIISNPLNRDHRKTQQYVIDMCMAPQVEQVNRFAEQVVPQFDSANHKTPLGTSPAS